MACNRSLVVEFLLATRETRARFPAVMMCVVYGLMSRRER